MKQLLFTKLPTDVATLLNCRANNFCSSIVTSVSTHYITWLFSFWIWSTEDVWNLHGFGPLGPSPGPPWGPHMTIWTTFESCLPLSDDSCQVWVKIQPMRFQDRRWNCKKFTDDGRRTNGIGNSSWWAKKHYRNSNHTKITLKVRLRKYIEDNT